METDFAVLRQYLEGAWLQARGEDETSRSVREALDALIDDVTLAEHKRPSREADIVMFYRRARSS
jgi:hypothetical protein